MIETKGLRSPSREHHGHCSLCSLHMQYRSVDIHWVNVVSMRQERGKNWAIVGVIKWIIGNQLGHDFYL